MSSESERDVVSSATDRTASPTKSTAGELLPCPFCGGEADYQTDEVAYSEMHYVQCMNPSCVMSNICTQSRDEKADAARDWNTRAPATPSDHPEEQRAQMKQETLVEAWERECQRQDASFRPPINTHDFLWLLRKLEERLPK